MSILFFGVSLTLTLHILNCANPCVDLFEDQYVCQYVEPIYIYILALTGFCANMGVWFCGRVGAVHRSIIRPFLKLFGQCTLGQFCPKNVKKSFLIFVFCPWDIKNGTKLSSVSKKSMGQIDLSHRFSKIKWDKIFIW